MLQLLTLIKICAKQINFGFLNQICEDDLQ